MIDQRRAILKAGAVLGAATVLGAPRQARSAEPRAVHLLSTYVAGTGYHAAAHSAAFMRTLQPGANLHLRREPQHSYYPGAVAVLTASEQMLGYVPGVDSRALASLMDAGVETTASLRSVTDDRPHPDIRLDIGVLL
jgi:hypothetical protein